MKQMILLDKKVIEEKIKELQENHGYFQGDNAKVFDRLFKENSKEVEVVNIDDKWMESTKDTYSAFVSELIEQGYKLIKIIE